MAEQPTPLDPVTEAVRFAEEYGYGDWSVAQDAYNRVRMRVFDLERFVQDLIAEGVVSEDRVRGELSLEPRDA